MRRLNQIYKVYGIRTELITLFHDTEVACWPEPWALTRHTRWLRVASCDPFQRDTVPITRIDCAMCQASCLRICSSQKVASSTVLDRSWRSNNKGCFALCFSHHNLTRSMGLSRYMHRLSFQVNTAPDSFNQFCSVVGNCELFLCTSLL